MKSWSVMCLNQGHQSSYLPKKEGINVVLIGEKEPETKTNADGTIKSSVVNLEPYNNETLSNVLW